MDNELVLQHAPLYLLVEEIHSMVGSKPFKIRKDGENP